MYILRKMKLEMLVISGMKPYLASLVDFAACLWIPKQTCGSRAVSSVRALPINLELPQ